MSDLAQALAAAESEAALWAGVEAEWKAPKHDLTAYFMRKEAKARKETAEKIAAEIKLLAQQPTETGDLDRPVASSGKALTGKAPHV